MGDQDVLIFAVMSPVWLAILLQWGIYVIPDLVWLVDDAIRGL